MSNPDAFQLESPVSQFREFRFGTEHEMCQHFDQVLDRSKKYFRLYREVDGEIIQPRFDVGGKQYVRIDRLLLPLVPAIQLGWSHGAIGVECKAKDKPAGKAISQAMDYARAIFCLPDFNLLVMLKWVFIYPFEIQKEELASIMAQHRIGHVCHDRNRPLVFKNNASNAIVFKWDGAIEINSNVLRSGNKAGNRG